MSALNSDAIPVPTRLRPDLRWSPYASDRPDWWVAHDPVYREFYFFSSVEKAIANCLDGNHSMNAIVEKSRRVDDSVSESFVRHLILRLDRASLLLHRHWRFSQKANAPTQKSGLTLARSALAFRIPLFNPSRAVAVLEPMGRMVFRGWLLWLLPGMVSLCVILLANRWPELSADLLTLQSRLRGDRVLVAAVLLLAIKGIHEFGHALACRTAGADCREIGLLFFLGAPCLYCDVSDAWRVSDRWKRIVVSAGGMIAELWIAILACVVWMVSSTAWIQDIALQVLLLCSVVTLLINANPLLRYDGYYILSDGLGIPNLADQSREAWQQLWRNGLFGGTRQERTIRTISFAMFHLASTLYRYFLLAALIWGFNHWLVQQRLGNFGGVLLGLVGLVILANVGLGLRRISENRRGAQSVSWLRLSLCGVLFFAVLWGLGAWSFPRYLFARGVIEPGEVVPLYARHSAMVQAVSPQENVVEEGATLIATASPELEWELLQAKGAWELAKVQIQQSALRSVDDPLAAQQIRELEKTARSTEIRVLKLEREWEQLGIRSPGSGRFQGAMMEQTTKDFAGRSSGRSERISVLAKDRPFVERGQQVGELVRPNGWQVKAYVSEREIDECQVGAMVFVRLDQWPGQTIAGRVLSISAESLVGTPKVLIGDTLFASTATGTPSESMPELASYAVSIGLNLDARIPIANGLASVQIRTPSMTILERWSAMLKRGWRVLRQSQI